MHRHSEIGGIYQDTQGNYWFFPRPLDKDGYLVNKPEQQREIILHHKRLWLGMVLSILLLIAFPFCMKFFFPEILVNKGLSSALIFIFMMLAPAVLSIFFILNIKFTIKKIKEWDDDADKNRCVFKSNKS